MLILEYHLQEILQGTKSMQYGWGIDQAFNPDGTSTMLPTQLANHSTGFGSCCLLSG